MSDPTLISPPAPAPANKYFKTRFKPTDSISNRLGRVRKEYNKSTESIRWSFVEAFRLLGGVEGLVKWGQKNPSQFYPLVAKLLPAEVAADAKGSEPIRILVYGPVQQQDGSKTCAVIEHESSK